MNVTELKNDLVEVAKKIDAIEDMPELPAGTKAIQDSFEASRRDASSRFAAIENAILSISAQLENLIAAQTKSDQPAASDAGQVTPEAQNGEVVQ